ncbi:HlyD family secretion protein [Gallaecimonas xiamenensis]|uniref:CzcB-like barrel-sandwich hybrid domain-containing protein n=1 Tax=Gallaecimonas xiamenensis 3-C-1 TaxID=745411 RepID=K2K0C6_9GAMM|nr:HlyD family efflux transporter periplasmic adaptor subunit [Gallaecimonas xiamenensis]EKE71000.1 hypothetical protein B3C1_13429 [Gallaecimonas xiamenensis 3-C-1]
MKIRFQGDKRDDPTLDAGVKVKYAPAKRLAFKLRWYLILLLVVSPILIFSWILLRDEVLVVAPAILTSEPIKVSPPEEAEVQQLLVKTGEEVKAGQPLVRLQSPVLDAEQSEVTSQLATLGGSTQAAQDRILASLSSAVESAQVGLAEQDSLVASFRDYRKRGIVPTADMAAILAAHSQAEVTLSNAKAALARELLRLAENQVAGPTVQAKRQLQRDLVRLDARLQQLTVKAPFDGRVVDSAVQTGEPVAGDRPLLWLAPKGAFWIHAYVPPRHINYAQPGSKVTVRFPDGTRLNATVVQPSELATELPRQLANPFEAQKATLKVTLQLNEPLPPRLRVEGLPLEVRFHYLW